MSSGPGREDESHESFFRGIGWRTRKEATAYIKGVNFQYGGRRVHCDRTGVAMSGSHGYVMRCGSERCRQASRSILSYSTLTGITRYRLVVRRSAATMYRTRAPAAFWVDIRSSCLVHERGCEAQGAASSQFLSTSCPAFRQAVLPAEGSPTVKQLKEVLRETAGISATTNAVYMARKKVERSSRSRYEASFRALSPWIRDFCISNAGSGGHVEEKVEGTWEGTFKRACLVSGAMAHMVRHCGLRVLGQVRLLRVLLLLRLLTELVARRVSSASRTGQELPHEPLGNLTLGCRGGSKGR